MDNLKKNIFTGVVSIALLVSIISLIIWGIRNAPDNSNLSNISNISNDSNTPAPNSAYTLTDNGKNGIDVRLESKTLFSLNFPITLATPITVSSAGQTMEIVQQDGNDFQKISGAQITKTEENSKLLDIIQEDPTLVSYQDSQGNQAFYTYQQIANEQKQALFKNWTVYNKPATGVIKVNYEMKNASVNIDSSGDAQIYFDSGKSTNSRPSDFTIPKPYFLDKDAARTDLNWQFDKTSHTLSVSLTAKPEQFPIALDPSVLKTDTVIATFSGKAIAMHTLACGDAGYTVSDIDGNTYNTILIGAQCWTAENMMTTKYPDGSAITRGPTGATWDGTDHAYYAYPQNINLTQTEETLANIQSGKLGFVYQWSAAMHGSTTAGAQGICPNGWHVPTHDEWTTLERAVCTSGTCATDFPFDTTTTGWRGTNEGSKLSTETSGGTNSSGFTAHLAGVRNTDGSFGGRSSNAALWSSLQSGGSAWVRYLNSGLATVLRNAYYKANGFSVRCLKN